MDAVTDRLTGAELNAIRDTFLKRFKSGEASWIVRLAQGDLHHALGYIVDKAAAGYAVKFYRDGVFQGILLWSVIQTAWSPKYVLQEELILAVQGASGVQRAAIQALEDIARTHRDTPSFILTGNFFQENNNLIGNGYKKAGFKQECVYYIKPVEREREEEDEDDG